MRFVRLVPCLALAVVASVTLPASAEDAAPKARLGADAALLIPVGDMSNATSLMIGPLVHFEYLLSPNLAVTGRLGYLYGLKKSVSAGGATSKYGLSDIPVWGGVKYYFGAGTGVYIGGELGLNILTASVDNPDSSYGTASASSSETKLGLNAGAGYRAGALDLRGGLSFLDLGHAGATMGLLASVGYSFASF